MDKSCEFFPEFYNVNNGLTVLFRLHREMHRALSLLPKNEKNGQICDFPRIL